jgi:hypothetical protein
MVRPNVVSRLGIVYRSLISLVLLTACSDMPDAEGARVAYATHRGTIDDVDQTLRRTMAELPLASAVRCEDAQAVVDANDPERTAEFERCSQRRAAWIDSVPERWTAFRLSVPLDLLDAHPEILGLDVRARSEGEANGYEASVGNTGASNTGTAAESGITLDDRAVGWHLYQTAFSFVPEGESAYVSYGDGDQRPGIDVRWTFRVGDANADVHLVLLTEDRTTDRWRAGQRRAEGR